MNWIKVIMVVQCILLLAGEYKAQVLTEVRGVVKDEAGISIFTAAVSIEGLGIGAITNEKGEFIIKNVPPGAYNISANFLGYRPHTMFNVIVRSVGNQPLNFVLIENADSLEEFTVFSSVSSLVRPKETPLSSKTLSATEIETYPGGNNDVVRVAQSLPGVSPSIGGFRNDLIIRGGAPNETVYFLDGLEIPNINHFSTQGSSGGPVGMLNVSFIEDVTLSSSSFSARYDNALSGVMQFKQKSGNKRKFNGNLRVGASETAITLNGPLFKGKNEVSKTGAIVSVRRSYLQFLFAAIGLPIRPDYWDYQYKIDHKINDYNYIYLLGIGSIDDFYLDGSGELDNNTRVVLEQAPYINQQSNAIGLTWKHILKSGKGYMETTLSNNFLRNDFSRYLDNTNKQGLLFNNNSSEVESQFRYSFTYLSNGWKLNYGFNGKQINYQNITSTATGVGNYDTNIDFVKYGVFFNSTRSFFKERFDVSVGVRMDDDTYTTGKKELANISPRLALAYKLSEKWKINGTVGRYYKIPPYTVLGYQENGSFTNKNLPYIRSDHAVMGLERFLGTSASISLEGFYKYYSDYPVSMLDSISLANKGADFEVLGNENIESIGKGRAYGFEFFYQQKLTQRFYGVFSYTFFYSEFSGYESNNYLPSLWDSRHLLTFTGGLKFKRNWELSARYRFAGKTPFVPVDVNATTISYPQIVLDYSQLGAQRLPYFSQLDVRLDKKWNLKKASVNFYMEIQNLLAQTSPAPSSYVLETDPTGSPVNPRNLIEVVSDDGTVIPTIGLVIDF